MSSGLGLGLEGYGSSSDDEDDVVKATAKAAPASAPAPSVGRRRVTLAQLPLLLPQKRFDGDDADGATAAQRVARGKEAAVRAAAATGSGSGTKRKSSFLSMLPAPKHARKAAAEAPSAQQRPAAAAAAATASAAAAAPMPAPRPAPMPAPRPAARVEEPVRASLSIFGGAAAATVSAAPRTSTAAPSLAPRVRAAPRVSSTASASVSASASASAPAIVPTAGPLPPSWYALRDPGTGATYFYNNETGATQWDAPTAAAAPYVPGTVPPAPQQRIDPELEREMRRFGGGMDSIVTARRADDNANGARAWGAQALGVDPSGIGKKAGFKTKTWDAAAGAVKEVDGASFKTRGKHQLAYLAYQAQELQQKAAAARSKGFKTKAQTNARYGW